MQVGGWLPTSLDNVSVPPSMVEINEDGSDLSQNGGN